jgi:nicotinamide phosphoribosyltransferase
MRGHASIESATVSGAAHLLSFTGTDTIPAIDFLEEFYMAGGIFVGGSVPATEHSVMCFGGEKSERETFRRMITEVYPKGIVSIVSDTWDYWAVLTDILPSLKNEIFARDGKVVVRPDSGDPVKIICGDPEAAVGSPAYEGTAQLLWKHFGGTVNSKGYRQLTSKIGMIYGDSITLDRANQICEGLKRQGFASTNIVFGIGSFTYQYVTRDTFGFAIKATAGMIDGEEVHVSKNPKTDNGLKKSARGFLTIERDDTGKLVLHDELSYQESLGGLLDTVFVDGVLIGEESLGIIRERVKSQL